MSVNRVVNSPLVSIIVLNHNGAEHLPLCLESLSAQKYRNIEVIVADNGSTDASRDICSRYPRVVFAELGYNYGFGRGNNEGAMQASGGFLFFVNNDMRFRDDMVGILVETIRREGGDVFALDSKQYNWSGDQIINAATRLKPGGMLRSQFCPFVDWFQFDTTGITSVPWANGATLFCRKDMFLALGGFDSTFFIDYEDTDLCWRAWLRGWKSLYVPQAECFHKGAATFSPPEHNRGAPGRNKWTSWRRKRYFSGQKNRVRFIMKTMGWKTNLLTFLRNHMLASTFLVQGKLINASTMIRSWWANILELPEILVLRQQISQHNVVASSRLIESFLN